ncbi:sialidase family protein [Streptomyces hoynatensis]|uniref:exo-alpha-sialidase n=1 Tax=Streptomyces hoynatensis TaxID=1141874 RepID=A0A3A9ZEV7_9ACTN|nr:sialidase family protein [Streptomyces hoynatensis]RKN46729.1 laminin G [Streptomyces hoynatensis]
MPSVRRSLAVLGCAAALLSGPLPAWGAEATGFEQQVLFKAAQEEGYACFRIPAIVETTRGTLLAFAEGRRDNCGDAGDIDLVLKRSHDGGRTWGPLEVVDEGGGDTHGNPAPVVDARTGRILLASTRNPGRDDAGNCDVPCAREPYLQYSDDDGETWSRPESLAEELRPEEWNSWYATGPLHGIQLTRGAHAGRLLFTLNAESFAGGRITANHAALAYSDDGGAGWQLGATDTWPVAADGTFRQKPSESAVVERSDGSLYVSAREQDGTDLGHRAAAVSEDGGESFAAPFAAIPDLYAPEVQGSLLSLPADDGSPRLLFASPADPDRRRTMMIRSSWDEGATWDAVDRGTLVSADWAGYSDLVLVEPGTVGLLYEGGTADARDEIRFARFTRDWLAPRRGPDPVTGDAATGAAPATVLGAPALTAGRYGRGMAFDGADDAVRLPYRETLPLGSGDFTVSLWFRYAATSGTHPFLWMGGVGTSAPQVWVRGEPANGRIRALMTAQQGASAPASAYADTSQAYNDGQWHHLSLVRADGRLTLSVDGAAAAGVADVPGSVSRGSTFGVHLGQRPDNLMRLTGALDEVRVYDRALTPAQLRGLRERNAAPGGEVLALPLDRVRQPRG